MDQPGDPLEPQPEARPPASQSSPSGSSQTASSWDGPRGSGDEAPPPESVGHYLIETEIGRGGMGIVYRARDQRLGRTVAVKALPSTLAADPRRRARFEREAKLLALVSHPNLAMIHAIEEQDDQAYLILEHVPGSGLADLLDAGPMPVLRAVELGRQVAAAVEAAHERGVIHRDLKPGNVRVTPDGVVKVLDFGLAKEVDAAELPLAEELEEREPELSRAGALMGTPAYMSPEQLAGEAVDERADAWAFGCLLWECLAGRRPWPPARLTERRALLLANPPSWGELPSGLPPRLLALLERCLEVEPARRLSRLGEAVEELELVAAAMSGRRSATLAPSGNLPRRLTSFLGREEELATARALLEDHALLTLTGPGGSGKTSLALELARSVQADHPDGVWLVDLAVLEPGAPVAETVAAALQVEEARRLPAALALERFLPDRRMLLLLDNCEHVIDEAARIVSTMLGLAPQLRVLATSREPLAVDGEQLLPVGPLEVGDETLPALDGQDSPAVRLFVERARAAAPAFVLDDSNRESVVEVCRRLDGLPFALELAAARVAAMSVEEIARRLDDRFRLLKGGARSAHRRHQTLRALIDWSHEQLDSDERKLLRRLSVFAGAATLEGIETVAADEELDELDVLELLTRLVARSLVQPVRAQGALRYRLLETVRAHAREHLVAAGELEAVERRHARQLVELAHRAREGLCGPDQFAWRDRLDADLPDLRALLGRGDRADADQRALIWSDLEEFWRIAGLNREVVDGTCALLADEGLGEEARYRILVTAGVLAGDLGELERSSSLLDEALSFVESVQDPRERIAVGYHRGLLEQRLGHLDESARLFREAIDRAEPLGDWRLLALAWTNLGSCAFYRGDYAEARAARERGLACLAGKGNARLEALVLQNLALVDVEEGDHEAALAKLKTNLQVRRRLRESSSIGSALLNIGMIEGLVHGAARAVPAWTEAREIFRRIGHREGEGSALNNLAHAAWQAKDWVSARELYRQALRLIAPMGENRRWLDIAENVGRLDLEEGHWSQGTSLLLAAERLRDEQRIVRSRQDAREHEDYRKRFLDHLDEEAFAAAREAAAALGREQLIELALREIEPQGDGGQS